MLVNPEGSETEFIPPQDQSLVGRRGLIKTAAFWAILQLTGTGCTGENSSSMPNDRTILSDSEPKGEAAYVEPTPSPEEQKAHAEIREMLSLIDGSRINGQESLDWPLSMSLSEGWTLAVDVSAISDLASNYGGDLARFDVETTSMIPEHPSPSYTGHKKIDFSDYRYDGVNGDPNEPIHWRIVPATDQEDDYYGPRSYISVSARRLINEDREPPSAKVYVELPWFSGEELHTGQVDVSRHPVVSERPMPKERYELAKAVTDRFNPYLHPEKQLVMYFADYENAMTFSKDPSVTESYVSNPGFDPLSGSVYVWEGSHTVESPEMLSLVLYHESYHAVRQSIIEHKLVESNDYPLERLFLEIQSRVGEASMETCNPEFNSGLAVFDESSYSASIGCNIGHPGGNAALPGDELFASAMNVLTTLEGQVIEKLDLLDEINSDWARRVIASCIELTDRLAEEVNQPPLIGLDSQLRDLG